MTKIEKFTGKHPAIWPMLGGLLFFLLIGALSGGLNVNIIFTCARLATFSLLLALAQMIVVTSGDGAIDLSQTYILTLCAYVSCSMMDVNPVLGLILSVLIGGFCGLVSGFINICLKVPAMITTLATGYMIFTVILVGAPYMKVLPNASFVRFVTYNLGMLSVQTIIAVAVAAILAIILYRTKYGKHLHAVGQNRKAAYLAGINTGRVVIVAFVTGGMLCGFAGVLCGAVMGGAFQDMGSAYFLPSVAAAFVGGTGASGGKSNVLGVCFGALMMSLMSSFLNTAESLYQFPSGIKQLIMGVFLVCILLLSVSNEKKQKQRTKEVIL